MPQHKDLRPTMSGQEKPLTPEELALADLAYFCKYPMGIDLWECHKRWADQIQKAIEDPNIEGIIVMAPPNHGKTTSITIPLILWLLARNQDSRICIGSAKETYAQQIGRAAAKRIERMRVLKDKFYLQPSGERWSNEEYVINRPNWEMKDASILCLGTGSEILSQRFDFAILEDALTPRLVSTKAKRDAFTTWYFNELDSRLEPWGKRIIICHRVGKEDPYKTMEGLENYVVIKEQAITSEMEQTVLAPERHSYATLAKKRERDPIGFALFYQQQELENGIYITRSQVENCKDPSRGFIDKMTDEIRSKYWKIAMSCDPAFSKSRWARYSVIGLWGITEGKRRDLLYGYRAQTSPEELINIVTAKFGLYDPDEFWTETNTGQSLLLPILRKKFPLKAHKINGQPTMNSHGEMDDNMRLIFDIISAGKDHFNLPTGDQQARIFVDQFIEEIVNYGGVMNSQYGSYNDILMSYYILESGLKLINQGERKGFVRGQGVVGGVSWRVRRQLGLR